MNYNYTYDDVNDYVNKNVKKWVKDVFRIHAPKLLSKAGLWTVVENLEVIKYIRNAPFELVIKFTNRNTDIELRFRDVGIGFTTLGEMGKDYIELYLSDYLTEGIALNKDILTDGTLKYFYMSTTKYRKDSGYLQLDKIIGIPMIKTQYGAIINFNHWQDVVALRFMYLVFSALKILFNTAGVITKINKGEKMIVAEAICEEVVLDRKLTIR